MNPITRSLLAELRALLLDEAPLKLVSDHSPEAVYAHNVGMPFTPPFRRYLSHPEQWGNTRVGMQSIIEVGEWCAQQHHTHQAERHPLCMALLIKVAYWGHPPPEILEPMLLKALRHAAHWRGRRHRPRLDRPLPYEPLQNRTSARRMRARRPAASSAKGRLARRKERTASHRQA